MHFLLVEDNELAIWMIQDGLTRYGHTVEIARTGREALRKFNRGFDAILLDACLPDINGIEVARNIRVKEFDKNIIIGISSLGGAIRDECLRAGFNDMHQKPVDIKKLLDTITKRIYDEKKTDNARGRKIS
jgi:CheY-like chemotaxis protein